MMWGRSVDAGVDELAGERIMASHRTSTNLWRPIKAVLGFPLKVLAGAMKGVGRAYNSAYYPGAGGGIVDGAPGRAPRRKPRRTHRRRSR